MFVQSYKLLPCKLNIKLYEYNARSLIMKLNSTALYYVLNNLISNFNLNSIKRFDCCLIELLCIVKGKLKSNYIWAVYKVYVNDISVYITTRNDGRIIIVTMVY